MQIAKVEVHNFCSIHDGIFELRDYTLLVGANNSGKTNTLSALRVFFGNLSYNPSLHEPQHKPANGQLDNDCWIDITFALTADEFDALDAAYQQPDRQLKVRRILRASDEKVKPGLYAYETTGLSKKTYKGPLGRVVYIPALSKAEDQTKTSGPSPLRDLVNDILTTVTNTSAEYQGLLTKFEEFTGKIKGEKTDGGRSLQGLEDEITRRLKPWDVSFSVNIGSMTADEIVKSLVNTRLTDQHVGSEQRIEQFGQGLQRQVIFELLTVKSEYLEQVGDNSSELNLLLFEEPEAFLHPSQQIELAERLRTIARDDGSQVVLSTHSPQFVSHESDNLTAVIRLHRDNGRTVLGQIAQQRLKSILVDNQHIMSILQTSKDNRYHPHVDDMTVDMEVIKYFMWLDPNRCNMFFASRVLLVEGATEAVLINYLIKHRVLKAPPGTFVLDCLGKFNIHRFMQILSELKVHHSVIYDDDNAKDIHPQLDAFIRSLTSPYTVKIETFSGCLEDELGVRSTTSPHRKPQHLLYLYQTGKIDAAKLTAFVQKIEALLN